MAEKKSILNLTSQDSHGNSGENSSSSDSSLYEEGSQSSGGTETCIENLDPELRKKYFSDSPPNGINFIPFVYAKSTSSSAQINGQSEYSYQPLYQGFIIPQMNVRPKDSSQLQDSHSLDCQKQVILNPQSQFQSDFLNAQQNVQSDLSSQPQVHNVYSQPPEISSQPQVQHNLYTQPQFGLTTQSHFQFGPQAQFDVYPQPQYQTDLSYQPQGPYEVYSLPQIQPELSSQQVQYIIAQPHGQQAYAFPFQPHSPYAYSLQTNEDSHPTLFFQPPCQPSDTYFQLQGHYDSAFQLQGQYESPFQLCIQYDCYDQPQVQYGYFLNTADGKSHFRAECHADYLAERKFTNQFMSYVTTKFQVPWVRCEPIEGVKVLFWDHFYTLIDHAIDTSELTKELEELVGSTALDRFCFTFLACRLYLRFYRLPYCEDLFITMLTEIAILGKYFYQRGFQNSMDWTASTIQNMVVKVTTSNTE